MQLRRWIEINRPLDPPPWSPLRWRRAPRRKTLSVLLANYNDSRFLPRVLTAITSQSRAPDEIIIGDDASTDQSVAVMERWGQSFPHISIVRSGVKRGNLGNLAHLLAQAGGDYVFLAAADDYMMPGFIEPTMRLAELYPDAGMAVTSTLTLLHNVPGHNNWCLDGSIPVAHPTARIFGMAGVRAGFLSPAGYRHFLETNSNPAGGLSISAIYRRELFAEFGGLRPEFEIWEIARHFYFAGLTYGMVYWPAPLFTFYLRREGWTVQSRSRLDEANALLDRVHALMCERPDLFSEKFRARWLERNRFALTVGR